MPEEFTEQDQEVLDDAIDDLKSGEEQDTDGEPEGKDTGQTDDSTEGRGDDDGFSEDVRAKAQAYNLDPNNFESVEALERQMDSIDVQWADYGRRQLANQQQVQQQPPQQQQVQQQIQPEDDFPFKLEKNEELYHDDFVDQMNGVLRQVHEFYKPVLEQVQGFQQYFQQQQAEREFTEFSSAVESLGHKELFGESFENMTQVQQQNATRLYQEAEGLAIGYRARGMKVPPVPELVKKAERLAFADQLKNYETRTRNARTAKQSKQRLGSGRRSSSFTEKGEWTGEPEDNPVLHEAYDRMIEEQGER